MDLIIIINWIWKDNIYSIELAKWRNHQGIEKSGHTVEEKLSTGFWVIFLLAKLIWKRVNPAQSSARNHLILLFHGSLPARALNFRKASEKSDPRSELKWSKKYLTMSYPPRFQIRGSRETSSCVNQLALAAHNTNRQESDSGRYLSRSSRKSSTLKDKIPGYARVKKRTSASQVSIKKLS